MATTVEYLAINIRRELKARGWTQAELAKRCEWPQPRIAEILAQRYSPRVATLDTIAKVLEITTSTLLAPPPENSEIPP